MQGHAASYCRCWRSAVVAASLHWAVPWRSACRPRHAISRRPTRPNPPTARFLPAGRKKRKGADGSESDSDGGADSPDGVHAGTLTLAQPQQGLADLAQKFMAMLTTVRGLLG